MLKLSVMQNRSIAVKRDNIAIGNLVLALARSCQVFLLDLKLAATIIEGLFSRYVALYGYLVRASHALELILGLGRSMVMKITHHRIWIASLKS